MIHVNLEDAQRNLKRYLRHVAEGETVVIVAGGKAVAELKPLAEPYWEPRPAGLCVGEFTVPDSFFDPLPEDLLLAFEGA